MKILVRRPNVKGAIDQDPNSVGLVYGRGQARIIK